jgi:putative colanic acid biosynthesis UDP-glucose lipid carrier transferase
MKSRESELGNIFIVIDVILLNFSICIVSWLRQDISLYNYPRIGLYLLHANLSLAVTYFIFSKKSIYASNSIFNWIKNLSVRMLDFLLVSIFLAFIFQAKEFYFRSLILEYFLTFYLSLLLVYSLVHFYFKRSFKNKKKTNRVLILGETKTSTMLQNIFNANPILGYEFVVSLPVDTERQVIIGKEKLVEIVRNNEIQVVFVVVSMLYNYKRLRELILVCNELGARIFFVPENYRWFNNKAKSTMIGGVTMINPQQIPLDSIELRVIKRVFDICFSAVIIVLIMSWLTPLVALLIKLSSKGPVFFVQKRTGINNKTFHCYKFRSMVVNNDADSVQASKNDKRTTWIGQFIRKTNIDELPQFFNVLIGDMSVVGPRPHMLLHTESYSSLIRYYLVRHFIKPGITGWAQVNGFRGETDKLWKMEKRVEYDIEYVENWNLWWDVKIILMTVFGKMAFYNAF